MPTPSSPPSRRRLFAARRPGAAARGEDGFILLESIVAISLITVVLAALGTFTLRSVTATNELRARQAATQIATSAMSTVDALPASDLITKRNKTSVDDQLARYPLNTTINNALAYMAEAFDSTPGLAADAGKTATIPTSAQPVQLNSIDYSVDTFIGTCVIPTTADNDPIVPVPRYCIKTGTGVTHYRVVVAVTWASGRGCSNSAGCTFVTSSLVNATDDPVFNINRATPPASPIVLDPGSQTSSVGGPVSLTLAVKAGTGVPPLTWMVTSGSLPTGLTLTSDGVISGTPVQVQTANPTVTVTDAFGRTGSQAITWTVLAAPTVTSPGNQSSRANTATSVPVASTCPNSPCTFGLTGAPTGLSINASTGVISGTPTTVGTSSNVVVTITDAAGSQTSSAPFTWTITAPAPTVTSPGNQRLTVGQTVSIPVPYTCPNPTCTITLSNGVPGLVLSNPTGSNNASTPETASKFTTPGTVDTTGTSNLALGKTATQSSNYNSTATAARAVDGNTDGVFNNGSVTHTAQELQPWWQVDLGSASLVRAVKIWNRTDCCTTRLSNFYVFTSPTDMTGKTAAQLLADPTVTVQRVSGLNGQPSITVPAQSAARYVRVQLSGVTGLTSDSYLHLAEVQVLGTADTGTSVTVYNTSGTVNVTGTVAASAVPTGTSKAYTPSLAITDASGTSSSTAAGTWTTFTAPTIATLANSQVRVQQVVSVPLAYTCPIAQCTLTLPTTVPGLGLSTTGTETSANGATSLTVSTASGTIYYSGKVAANALPSGNSASYSPQIVITDANAVAASTTSTWTVAPALIVAVPDQASARPILGTRTYTVNTANFVTPSGGTYTYALSGAPTWLSINPNTGVMTATVSILSLSDTSITVTVTSTSAPTATASDTFSWTLQ